MVLFGSMLKPEVDRLSDVDVAVEIVPKEADPDRARANAEAERNRYSSGGFTGGLGGM